MAKLYFRYGTMNSGKSLQLLAVAHNYENCGMKVLLTMNSTSSSRDGLGVIKSRVKGFSRNVDYFLEDLTFKAIIEFNPDCILVDEAQFLTEEQVKFLADVVSILGIPVICYGIRTDFQGKLFTGSKALFELAHTIQEVVTVCNCGSKTMINMRIDGNGNPIFDGEQVHEGAEESYKSVCYNCFLDLQFAKKGLKLNRRATKWKNNMDLEM